MQWCSDDFEVLVAGVVVADMLGGYTLDISGSTGASVEGEFS